MGITDRVLGKKNVNGNPHIEAVVPDAALPGGEVRITGSGLRPHDFRQPAVRFGEVEGAVVVSADEFLVARVPYGASGPVVVSSNGQASNAQPIRVAALIAENLHPVTNPALDAEGNVFVTFSGSRGQKVPIAIFKIDTSYEVKPFLSEMMNPTAIALTAPDKCTYPRALIKGLSRGAQRNHVVVRGRHGRGHRNCIRPRRESLCGGPQWNYFQDRTRPSDLRFCHLGTECFRLSLGLQPTRRFICHGANRFEF